MLVFNDAEELHPGDQSDDEVEADSSQQKPQISAKNAVWQGMKIDPKGYRCFGVEGGGVDSASINYCWLFDSKPHLANMSGCRILRI